MYPDYTVSINDFEGYILDFLRDHDMDRYIVKGEA